MNKHVVIVEDNIDYLNMMKQTLVNAFPSYTILGFQSNIDLMKTLSPCIFEEIELIIADAILGPIGRGADILQAFTMKAPHVKRVLMSNKATRADLEYAINECSLDGYIEKREEVDEETISLINRLLLTDRITSPIEMTNAIKIYKQIDAIDAGRRELAHAYKYLIRDLFSYLFYPCFRSPKTEVNIRNATKSVDILFYNSSDFGILKDLKQKFDSLTVPIEAKNSKDLTSSNFSQIEGYLIDSIGRFGIICFRGEWKKKYLTQLRSIQNQRKMVLIFNDHDLERMLRIKRDCRREGISYIGKLDEFLREMYLNVL